MLEDHSWKKRIALPKTSIDPSGQWHPERANDDIFLKQKNLTFHVIYLVLPKVHEFNGSVELRHVSADGSSQPLKKVYPAVHPNNFVRTSESWLCARWDICTLNEYPDNVAIRFRAINWKHNWDRRLDYKVNYKSESGIFAIEVMDKSGHTGRSRNGGDLNSQNPSGLLLSSCNH